MAGVVLERVCGDPRDVLCHQLKAVLVPRATQLMGHSGTRCGEEKGCSVILGSTFLGCLCITVLIAAPGGDVCFWHWRVGVRRRRRGMLC